MTKLLLLAIVSLVALCAATGATAAVVTETQHIHGTFSDPNFTDVNPCNGSAITSFEADGNLILHHTYFVEDGEITGVRTSFTETGKVAISDASGVSYGGHFTLCANFHLTDRASSEAVTLTIRVKGSDGSTILGHELQHFSMNANGEVTAEFDRMRLTCA